MRIEMLWLAAQVAGGLHSDDATLQKYFSVSPHSGLLNRHNLARHLWILPIRLAPKDGFHRLATRNLANVRGELVRLPYLDLELGTDLRGSITTISADLFPGDVLVTRVGAKLSVPLELNFRSSIDLLGGLRSSKSLPIIHGLIRQVAVLAAGAPRKSMDDDPVYSSYFGMSIRLPHDAATFDEVIEPNKRHIAALLIGSRKSEVLRDELVERVFSASDELNVKSRAELLLLNRQGFVYLLPAGDYQGPHLHRFDRTRDLATLACYARGFLREGHHYAIKEPEAATDLVRRLAQWIEYPHLTFETSMSHTLTWKALSQELLLDDRLAAWEAFFAGTEHLPNQLESSQR